MKISVVMPALNEEKTVGLCVQKARAAFKRLGMTEDSEVVVVDNGSHDSTAQVAEGAGARVVLCKIKGYGNAYQAGLKAALGEFVVTGDADDSYNFEEIEPFVRKLEQGYEFVIGNRFRGRIEPGAMPWLHRFIGTPFLTGIMNLFFHTGIGDVNCGMRGMTKKAVERMHLKAPGMEFATEMVIKAYLAGLKIAEVPCNLYRDRRGRRPHLRTFSDGWRYLRFMLLFTPTWTFLVPGVSTISIGLAIMASLTIRDIFFPVSLAFISQRHMLSGLLLFLLGSQIVTLGIAAGVFGYSEYFDKNNSSVSWIRKRFTLERGMMIGACLAVVSALLLLYLFVSYYWHTLSLLGNEAVRLDIAILAIGGVLLGVQFIFGSFLLSLNYLRVK